MPNFDDLLQDNSEKSVNFDDLLNNNKPTQSQNINPLSDEQYANLTTTPTGRIANAITQASIHSLTDTSITEQTRQLFAQTPFFKNYDPNDVNAPTGLAKMAHNFNQAVIAPVLLSAVSGGELAFNTLMSAPFEAISAGGQQASVEYPNATYKLPFSPIESNIFSDIGNLPNNLMIAMMDNNRYVSAKKYSTKPIEDFALDNIKNTTNVVNYIGKMFDGENKEKNVIEDIQNNLYNSDGAFYNLLGNNQPLKTNDLFPFQNEQVNMNSDDVSYNLPWHNQPEKISNLFSFQNEQVNMNFDNDFSVDLNKLDKEQKQLIEEDNLNNNRQDIKNSLLQEANQQYQKNIINNSLLQDANQQYKNLHDAVYQKNPELVDEYTNLKDKKDSLLDDINSFEDTNQAKLNYYLSKLKYAKYKDKAFWQQAIDDMVKNKDQDLYNLKNDYVNTYQKYIDKARELNDLLKETNKELTDNNLLSPEITKEQEKSNEVLENQKPLPENNEENIKHIENDIASKTSLSNQQEATLSNSKQEKIKASNIEEDLTKKLIDVGRPIDEAQASAKLEAQFFNYLSNIHGGKLGTALELYNKHGADYENHSKAIKIVAKEKEKQDKNFDADKSIQNLNHVKEFNPNDLLVDAKTYQYKEGGDEKGVTLALKGTKEWNPASSGIIIVHHRLDGKYYVADGHQRTGLARRLLESNPDKNIKILARVFEEKDGWTPENVRREASIANIAQGSGTAIDAAKIIRTGVNSDILNTLPPNSKLVQQSIGLSKLGDDAFGMVINGKNLEEYGSLVGKNFDNPQEQLSALKFLNDYKPKLTNENEIMTAINTMKADGFGEKIDNGQTSFDFADASQIPLTMNKIRLINSVISNLLSDKNVFKNAVKNSSRLKEEGNQLLDKNNEAKANEANQMIEFVRKQANLTGEISNIFKEQSKVITTNGKSISMATKDVIEKLKKLDTEGTFGEMYEKEPADDGQMTFFQNNKLGSTVFDKNKKDLVKFFDNADASTWFHEAGHRYLNIMKKYATMENSPKELKEDFQAVKDFVGAKSDNFTRTQHEKFARGFETYLYEGISPNSKLTKVFEQIKQWMQSIYKSAKELKAPINENIRNVFDKMMGGKDNSYPIIADHQFPAKDIHEIHTNEANNANLEHSEYLLDLTKKELENEKLPEEIFKGIDRGRNQGEIDNSQHTNNVDETSKSINGNKEEIGGGGEVSEGNDNFGEKGDRALSEPALPDGRRNNSYKRRIDETLPDLTKSKLDTKFDPEKSADSPFDKDLAGNINLDNLNLSEDAKNLIRQNASENQDYINQRRGVVTDNMVMHLASLMAENPSVMKELLDNSKAGKAFNAEEIKALIITLDKTSNELWKHAKENNEAEFVKYLAMFEQVQKAFHGAIAESGRALRALKPMSEQQAIMEFFQSRKSYDTKSLMAAIQESDSPASIAKTIKDMEKIKPSDLAITLVRNNLISGPTTHFIYELATMLNVARDILLERPASYLMSKILPDIKEENAKQISNKYYLNIGKKSSEIFASLQGLKQGVETGTSMFFRTFATNDFENLRGIDRANENLRNLGQEKLDLKNKEEKEKTPFFQQQNIIGDYFKSEDKKPTKVEKYATAIGNVLTIPGRVVGALHAFNRSMFYEMEIHSFADRIARNEGLNGDEYLARVSELISNPPDEVLFHAQDYANKMAYMEIPESGTMSSAVEKFANTNLGTQILMPFTRVAMNIAKRNFIERSPIGLFTKEIRDNLMGRNGELKRQETYSRMLVGTALYGIASSYYLSGTMTGPEPFEEKEREIWQAQGKQAYSIRIGDRWYQYKRLGDLGQALGAATALADSIHRGLHDPVEGLISFGSGFAKNFIDETWMSGIKNFIDLVEKPQNYKRIGANFTKELIPFTSFGNQMARLTDDYERKTNSYKDEISKTIPFMRQSLFPIRNIWGQPIEIHGVLLGTHDTNDLVSNKLQENNIFISMPKNQIKGVALTPQQNDEYQKIAGGFLRSQLEKIVLSNNYDKLPQIEKEKLVENVITQSRNLAQNLMLAKYTGQPDDIAEKAKALKNSILEYGKKEGKLEYKHNLKDLE